MKKFLSIAALLLVMTSLGAQEAPEKTDKGRFALGVTAGLPEGLGLSAAVRVSDYVQFRTGYSLFPYTYNKVLNFKDARYVFNQGLPNERTLDFTEVPLKGNLFPGGMGNVLADFFLGRTTNFHISFGCFIASNKVLRVRADMREIVAPEDWATFAVSYQGLSISTDAEGYAYLDARTPSFLPYLGIGFGRAVGSERVRFVADFGAIFTNGISFTTYSFIHDDVREYEVHSYHLVNRDGEPFDREEYIDRASRIPVIPMVRLNLFIKLF